MPDKHCLVNCMGHHKYDASQSSTSKNIARPFFVAYGSGGAAGFQYEDRVGVATYQVDIIHWCSDVD